MRTRAAGVPVPRYFDLSWQERLRGLLTRAPTPEARDFASANADFVTWLTDLRQSLRAVFNLGGHALLAYLRTGDYLNVYERPVVQGRARAPSAERLEADRLIDLDPPQDFYFCAMATDGVGMRAYGEYCAVIKPDDCLRHITRVADRDSYDLLVAPLRGYLVARASGGRQHKLISRLMSRLHDGSCQTMLAVKVLQRSTGAPRRLTAGTVAEALLDDEDYCEAYHRGKIGLDSLQELRENPADMVFENDVTQRFRGGEAFAPAEMMWARRRQLIRAELQRCGLARVVADDGPRSGRWT